MKRSHRFFVISLLSIFLTVPLFSTSIIASADSILQAWYKPDTTRQAPTEEDAIAFAVDASGNVYIAGWTAGNGAANDFLTAKYSADGVRQWLTHYHGTGNDYDYVNDMVVDAEGNVYVTGRSVGDGTGADCVTIKYNSAGVQQWVARYNGTGNAGDGGRGIALDSRGNVFVTGISRDSAAADDMITIMYDPSGVQQWVNRYSGPGANADYGVAVATDDSGNAYAIGCSWGTVSTGYDYVTIKYNPAGAEQWSVQYNGTGSRTDEPHALVLDDSANVYVTGRSRSASPALDDYATIKYSSSGVQQWIVRYNGPSNGSEDAWDIVLDDSGNVYVTGWSPSSTTGIDMATIKYDNGGNLRWLSRYSSPGYATDRAYALVVDQARNVYVTGGLVDMTTVKYDADGNERWVALFKRWGSSFNYGQGIGLDNSGNVHISGSTIGAGFAEYTTIKYSPFVSDVVEEEGQPSECALEQNYPNPFNPRTVVSYHIPVISNQPSVVSVKVFDVLGREVAVLVDGLKPAGRHTVAWDAAGMPSGVYFARLNTGRSTRIAKMLLQR